MAVWIFVYCLPRKAQCFLRRIQVTRITKNEAKPLQGKCGDAVAGRHGFVRQRFQPVHECFVIICREIKSASLIVVKMLE